MTTQLAVERRISHLRKAVETAAQPSGSVLYDLINALLDAGDRTAAIEAYRRYANSGATVSPELRAAYERALLSAPRELAHNLPVTRTLLVGRSDEMDRTANHIATERRAQIVGTGGMGKTRLALEFARRSLADYEGVWWVDCSAASSPEELYAKVARALRFEDRLWETDSLCDRIGDSRALLVLDCCEGVIDVAAAFVGAIVERCPNAAIVATSRIAIDGRTPAIRLQPLTLSESVVRSEAGRLFLERAVDADPQFTITPENAEAVSEICRAVGAIPLGIELACAYLAHVDVHELQRRLSGRRSGEIGSTLAGTMRWTYEMLPLREQRLLRALSVFEDAFTLDDAIAIAGEEGTREALERLAQASLAVDDREYEDRLRRFRLLDSTRQFAREEAERAGERDADAAHFVDYIVAIATESSARIAANDSGVSPYLSSSLRNILAALDLAADDARFATKGLQIAAALGTYLGIIGFAAQSMLHIERLIEAARGFGADTDQAFDGALEAASWLANRVGKPALSMEINEERIRRARASGDVARLAQALATSVIAPMNAGQQERGLEIASEAVEAARASGRISIRARALRSIGAIYLNLNRPADTVKAYEEFFSLDESQIPPVQYAVGLHDYGLAYKELHQPEQARPLLTRSIERALAIGDYGAACHGYQTLGAVLFESGNHRAAFEHFRKGVEVSVNNINLRTQLEALEHLVSASIREDQYQKLAFILGVIDARRAQLGGYKPSAHQEEEAEAIRGGLRSRMGQRAFETAYVHGQSSTIAQAVEAALALECGTISIEHADRLSVLTAREREIALLAAKGASNKDIAEALTLSVRTVETHIASIFRKLGIDRRERILN